MAYFSNGSEADILANQCCNCILGKQRILCPILKAQLDFNYDAVNNKVATEILNILVEKETGCQMFVKYKNSLEIENGWDCK